MLMSRVVFPSEISSPESQAELNEPAEIELMGEMKVEMKSELENSAESLAHGGVKSHTVASTKNSALGYLARRDYSRLELYQKLIAKGLLSDTVNQVLDDLQAQGYQSDERFAEMFIRSRMNAGDGPFKIKISLRGKGICDSLALAVIDKMQIDWFERVKILQKKRFGDLPAEDLTETTKRIRYLKSKGFYQDHIEAVIECSH
jgi:regulatory protein